jgi:hypothetical protein
MSDEPGKVNCITAMAQSFRNPQISQITQTRLEELSSYKAAPL